MFNKLFCVSEMNYALVAGWSHDEQRFCPKMEVIYVNGTIKTCQSTANYPEKVWFINGGSFLKNNFIFACGGYPPTSACYSMSNDLKWTYFANLTGLKWGIESVVVKNGLWLTGNDDKLYPKFK